MNVALIQQLNIEHSTLIKILNSLNVDEGLSLKNREQLAKFKVAFYKHQEKEESEFYPVMRKAAESNASLKKLLTVMGEEMDEISQKFLSFWNLWMASKGAESFRKDFSTLTSILAARIQREEHSLYARFLKLTEE